MKFNRLARTFGGTPLFIPLEISMLVGEFPPGLGVRRDTVRRVRLVRGINAAEGTASSNDLDGVDALYAIANTRTRRVKIGRGLNPEVRLRSIRTMAADDPAEFVIVGVAERQGGKERRLHEIIGEHRLHGEWFAEAVLESIFGAHSERDDAAFAAWIDRTWTERPPVGEMHGPRRRPGAVAAEVTVRCEACDRVLETRQAYERGRFCSKACFGANKSKTKRAAWPTCCAWCSKPLEQRRKKRSYCDRACAQQANGERERMKSVRLSG